jgi:tRNA pseudouridine38-40 synthase
MRIALGLQYDGAAFSGWQTQPNGQTLQDHLEKAIAQFIGNSHLEIKTITAGRTDAGVHALGQVIHFDAEIDRPDFSWVRGINAFLPKAMAVHWAKPVPITFDARYSAFERTYYYALFSAPNPMPLIVGKAGLCVLPQDKHLDIEAMKKASLHLIGEHDFSSFRSSECQSKTPVKTLYQLDIHENGPWTYFVFRGNAFLHHMVRNLMGSLLAVGMGKESPDWMEFLLNAKNRQLAAPTFMPDGLYLARVGYPAEYEIPRSNTVGSLFPMHILE